MIGQKLKLRYLKPRQWCDKYEVLIHAMFEVLCRFMEDEPKMIKLIKWNYNPKYKHAKAEMDALYKWWKKRQNREDNSPFNKLRKRKIEISPELKKGKEVEPGCFEFSLVHKSPKHKLMWEKVCDEENEFEEQCREEDDDAMKRLIKIHRFMWT